MRVQNRMCWNGIYWNTVYQVKFSKTILIFYYWIFISWALVHQISTVYFHCILLPLFWHSFIIAYHLNSVCQSSNSDNAWHARHNKIITFYYPEVFCLHMWPSLKSRAINGLNKCVFGFYSHWKVWYKSKKAFGMCSEWHYTARGLAYGDMTTRPTGSLSCLHPPISLVV